MPTVATMEELIVFAALGLGAGALVAGNALGLVLVYRGTGAINLATGATAALAGFVFYGLRTGAYFFSPLPFGPERFGVGPPWATVPAFAVTLLVCAVLGLILTAIFRRLRDAAPLAKIVAGLGVMLVLLAIIHLRFGEGSQVAPAVLPTSGTIELFGTPIPVNRFMLAGIVIVAAAALAAIYRFTRFGLATRAASADETAAVLAGLNPDRLAMINTVTASVLVGALGVLVAPISELNVAAITLAVVPALCAALLARFTSFGVAVAAGLGMGILQSIVTYLETKPWFPTANGAAWPGVPALIYLVVIAIALLWRGDRLPVRGYLAERRLPPAPAPAHLLRPALAAAVGGTVALIMLPPDLRQALIFSFIGAIFCLALVVITGLVGQVSLCQLALAGIAGLMVSRMSEHLGLGFPLGPVIAVIAATAIGLVIALSALRVRGVNLAIVTLAAAVAIEQFGFQNVGWGGGAPSVVPPPHLFGINFGTHASFPGWGGALPSPTFGLFVLFFLIAAGLMVSAIRRSAVGQRMLAVRSNERAAEAVGISVRNTKLLAFGLSSGIAGLGGVLFAYNLGAVDVNRFGLMAGLGVVALAYLGGITTVSGAMIGGLLAPAGLLSYLGSNYVGIPVDYQLVLYGLSVVLAVVFVPEGASLRIRAKLGTGTGAGSGSVPTRAKALLHRTGWAR
jgi:branched-chain amino acid transport system permease protein